MPETDDSTTIETRVCPSCGETRPASSFRSKHPRTHCDVCHASKGGPSAGEAPETAAPSVALVRRDDELVMGDEEEHLDDEFDEPVRQAVDVEIERAIIGDPEIARELATLVEHERAMVRELLSRGVEVFEVRGSTFEATMREAAAVLIRGTAKVIEQDMPATARALLAALGGGQAAPSLGACPVLGQSMRDRRTVRTRGVEMSERGAAAVRAVIASGHSVDEIEAACRWLRERGEA